MRTVVLVDDDQGFLETLGALLRQDGYTVVLRDTAASALAYLAEQRADVLITDVGLGADNGWLLAKHAAQHHPEMQVLVVTALADQLDAEIEYWRLPVFLKPFDADVLLNYLRTGARDR